MSKRSAITKLQIVLLIDVIIVAFAAGGYFYVGSGSEGTKAVSFVLSDLTVTPAEVEVGQPVKISVNITNVGTETGDYAADLFIDDNALNQSKIIQISSTESTIAEFIIEGLPEGTHTAKIEDLTESFKVTAPVPTGGDAETTEVRLHSLKINPTEAWPGSSVSMMVSAQNFGTSLDTFDVELYVDNALVETKTVPIHGGSTAPVTFNVIAGPKGTHSVKLTCLESTLTGAFDVVPEGMHTLTVGCTAAKGADFTIDGKPYRTPVKVLLSTGSHTIVMPPTDPTGEFAFLNWEDGNKSPTRTIYLTNRMSIYATYEGGSSCPSLYFWNGEEYVYVAEISNGGWLGYIGYIDGNGDIVFLGGNPWDHAKLDQLQLRNIDGKGYYDLLLSQRWNEIFYLDAAYMLAVDHPSDADVYATMMNYMNPAFTDKIYTVSKNNIKTPISAVNEKGEDVLFHISTLDNVFTPGNNGPNSPAWNNIIWNRLTLDLGDLSNAPQIKLVINGMVDWGPASAYYDWIAKFEAAYAEGLVSNGTQINPPPYMEVKDANGHWVRVPEDRQLPIPADYVARTFVVDLTGIFPDDVSEYQLRINNFWNVTFDYIGIDTSLQETLTTQRIDPEATLYQVFNSPSAASGKFTRYGDVTELLLNADDIFVIGRQADAVSLLFPAEGLAPPAEGMERTFFLFVADWFKDEYGNWGYGFDFTVDPLPFRNMSGFPYPSSESYPYDDAHLRYMQEYNTRDIKAPQTAASSLAIWVTVVIAIVAVTDVGVLVYFRKRSR